MNENAFNDKLSRIAPDMRLLWDAKKRLWGIYQTRNNIITLNSSQETKPWLMWDCKDTSGKYRLPSNDDLERAQQSARSGHEMWRIGGENYVDKIDAQKQARRDKDTIDRKQLMLDMARDFRFHNTVVSNRR